MKQGDLHNHNNFDDEIRRLGRMMSRIMAALGELKMHDAFKISLVVKLEKGE